VLERTEVLIDVEPSLRLLPTELWLPVTDITVLDDPSSDVMFSVTVEPSVGTAIDSPLTLTRTTLPVILVVTFGCPIFTASSLLILLVSSLDMMGVSEMSAGTGCSF
jgi:hypothetical protein